MGGQTEQPRLVSTPMNIKRAVALVAKWHRHAPKVVGGLFAVAVRREGDTEPCGVAIVGRPVARMMDDGTCAEVTRVATDGTPNACSKLYGMARSIAFKMGYQRVTTTTLQSEPGTSLEAAGFSGPVECGGGSWDRPSRPRTDKHDAQRKFRWDSKQGDDE